jgi:hypothetical protein
LNDKELRIKLHDDIKDHEKREMGYIEKLNYSFFKYLSGKKI